MTEPVQICTNCNKKVQKSNYTVHSVHCQRNVTVCATCNEAVPKGQYDQHVSTTHAKAKCPNCTETIEAKMLSSHQEHDCQNRMLTCKYCEVELKAREMEKHVDFCGARTERCKGCSKFVQSRHLQFHYDTDHMYLNPKEKEKADANGKELEDDECPICLGPVTLPIALECGHVFCMVCVKGIANSTKNCAICRRDINRDMLMDIRFCVEEEVIRNYVKNSKYKKNPRSKSVPGRCGKTTEDYDDMVSALLTNRTASSSYRYERPSNGRTPRSYRPYCFSSSTYRSTRIPFVESSATGSSSSSSNDEDDCSGSSSSASPVEDDPMNRYRQEQAVALPVSSRGQNVVTRRTSSTFSSSVIQTSTRKRPTSLALSTSTGAEAINFVSKDEEDEVPQTLTQEEYDRWLAFQLAKSEDDLTPAEFNNRHRNPMRRSLSMPESQGHRSSNSNDTASKDSVEGACALDPESPNGLPPVVPRRGDTHSSSSTIRASVLTKSSSESSASVNGNSSNNTGARPKSSTGLRKRVSFKENSPPRKRAPVLLPCEFCNKMIAERDLMRHQTSCDQNETKNPQEYLMSRRSSASSPLTSPISPLSPSSSYQGLTQTEARFINENMSEEASTSVPSLSHEKSPVKLLSAEQNLSGSSSEVQSPVSTDNSPVSSPCGPAAKPPASPMRNTEGSNKQNLTRSPSSRTKFKLMKQSSAQSPSSTPSGSFSEGYHSGPASRNASISPCNEKSANTSGIDSATSSLSNGSVSSSPSSSASNSPVPDSGDSKTNNKSSSSGKLLQQDLKLSQNTEDRSDIEPTAPPLPMTEDETPIPQPRKGKLLCSAISSWKSLAASRSGSRNSNLSPTSSDSCVRSKSAPQFKGSVPDEESTHADKTEDQKSSAANKLIVLPKKSHRAPSPPRTTPKLIKSVVKEMSFEKKTLKVEVASVPKKQKAFKFDSMPVMNGSSYLKDESSEVSSTKSEDPSEDDSVEYNPFYYCREEDEEVISPKCPTKRDNDHHDKSSAVKATSSMSNTTSKANDSVDSSVTVTLRKKKSEAKTEKPHSESKGSSKSITTKNQPSSSKSDVSGVDAPLEMFSCNYCDKMFTKEMMHDHKKACKKINKKKSDKKRSHDKSPHKSSGSPTSTRKNKKGPAPKPPSERSMTVELPAIGRSNSVRERRSDYKYNSDSEDFGGRIERACSIKETSSRYSRMSEERSYLSRRWMSRDSVYGGGLEGSGAYSGTGSLTSSTTSLNNLSGGRGWSPHINMLREDFRSRRASTSLGVSFSSGLYSGLGYRERSISRSRPSSLYSSRNACNIIADSFIAVAEKNRYLR